MNNGAFGENFPYSNFHDLNMDWIISIVKDFLNQYTTLQETIDDGLEELDAKKTEIEGLLDAWYAEHSQDIANELANALVELNAWYAEHSQDIANELANALVELNAILVSSLNDFTASANAKAAETIESIPSDYSHLYSELQEFENAFTKSRFSDITNYLTEHNKYFNSGTTYTLNGFDVYKIPVQEHDLISITTDNDDLLVPSGFNSDYTMQVEISNGQSYIKVNTYPSRNVSAGQAFSVVPQNATNIYLSLPASITGHLQLSIIKVNAPDIIQNGIYSMSAMNVNTHGAFAKAFPRNNSITVFDIGNNGVVFVVRVMPGDRITYSNDVASLGLYSTFLKDDGTLVDKGKNKNVIYDAKGYAFWLSVSVDNGYVSQIEYYPAYSLSTAYEDILDVPQYVGLSAVAFGTSLTSRSTTSEGYLDYLPTMSGMTIENQGIGSGVILDHPSDPSLPSILGIINSYSGLANKDICILEGFVNDWYYNPDKLGTWKDIGTTTVCGCVRNALNKIRYENSNITVFLILDHVGKTYNGVSNDSGTANSEGLTQYEYYEEIAKVAESCSVHVIPLYKISGIDEYTPQYLVDNIHPTALGAQQTAQVIWDCMKQVSKNK